MKLLENKEKERKKLSYDYRPSASGAKNSGNQSF